MQRTARVHVEVRARIDEARRDRHLRREMIDMLYAVHRGAYGVRIPHVAFDEFDAIRKDIAQPLDVLLRTGACERVEDAHLCPRACKPLRDVRSDESGTARDKNASGHSGSSPACSRLQIVKPRRSSSDAACRKLSVADACASHSPSSINPSSNFTRGSYLSDRRALSM